ncbi:hypothetical protein Avbf_05998 [Armadillidium vulgare]|nr:hypothetical protein Avbf_05998 [Armadillidium vulgare]
MLSLLPSFYCVRITSGGGVKGKQSLSHRISAGWRARRSARDERLVEGDEGFASFTPSRRQFYSRTLSRDLPLKTSSEDFQRTGSRNSWDASTSSGTIPRTGTATGSTIPTQFNQESSNKLASKSSISDPNTRTMRESNNNPVFRERPLSATGSTMSSGEAYGRVGGHFEQHKDKSSASFKSDKDKQESNTGKQSVQQLKDLVSELESVTEENSDAREKNSKANVTFLTTSVKCPLQSPKPSKSFTSLQMQQHNLINQSNSNPNIVFSITITPRNQQLLSKNMISSNAGNKETNIEEKNSKEYGLSDTLINSHDDNQHDTISSKKTPKNTFTPYSPISSSVGKNAIFNKQKVSDTTKVSNDIKSEKVADNQSVPLSKVNEVEKTKDLELHSEKSTEKIKTGTYLPSYLKSNDTIKSNDTFKVENKHLLNVEPYRRGRSEDLKVAIDLANSSSSSTVDSGRSIKPYKKSKSRDITPTIEAASERFTQLNSGNLRKISPFEAYRRSKSKELSSSIDIVNNSTENRMRSPPPTSDSTIKSDSSMSQFEKARTSIEKKFEKAKSPPIELETTIKEVPNSPLLLQESKDDTTNESQKEKEKQSKEIKESDKPKSVYKILTTKFTRSLSNLGEDKQDKSQNKDNTEENDKEEKFKLKRPSIFMKKMEKSSSKTSIAETENKDDDTDKNDKKSNKLSYALNKFLGRKPEETSSKMNKNDTLIAPKKSTSVVVIPEKVKKPPRFRTKKFSKSQENLNQGNEDEEFDHETRSKSVFPDSEQTTEVEDKNIPSKETNSHLSQIEIKITPTINNTIHSYDSKPKVSSSQDTNYSPSIASYGLSPALINKRLSSVHSNSSDKDLPSPQTELDIGSKKKLGHEFTEERSVTPIESSPSGLEDIKEAEDESVMDRITRKSYYTRFNEMKRKPKPKRIDSRETMDQQLAAAKARLMQEESREAASSSRMTPQRTFTSISPPLILDGVIRRPSKGTLPRTISLPPDDGFVGGSRNSPFNNQEETFKSMRYQSSEREPVGFYRSNSITREEPKPYRRQLSTNLDEAYSNHKRLSSVGREDPPFFLRQPSIPRDDEPPTFRLPSVVKDEPPSYRRLSAALRDEPQLRDSSLTKDESFSYNKMPSTSLRDSLKDKRQPSIPRDTFGHRRSLSRDFSNQHKNNETHISTINSPTNGYQQRTKDSDNSSENYEKSDAFAAANAAGKAAGEAAAAAVAVSPTQRIPSPLCNISASDPERCKISQRRINETPHPINEFSTNKTTGLERPYRRTTTTDLPPLDSRIRTNDLRRFQEPSRRFSGIRSVENGIDSKPSPAMLSPSTRSPYSSYVTPTSSISPFQSPPSMNTILRRTSLYRY